jgi:hypothetical protein
MHPITSCAIAIFSIAVCAPFAWAQACFDNQQLALVQQETKALLYVWSPRMVLSAHEAASVRQQARAQGLRFVPLHDAQVPGGEISAALKRMASSGTAALVNSASSLKNSQALCASALLERDALRHFPTAFVLLHSGLAQHALVGAMPASAWATGLRQRLTAPPTAPLTDPLTGPLTALQAQQAKP